MKKNQTQHIPGEFYLEQYYKQIEHEDKKNKKKEGK